MRIWLCVLLVAIAAACSNFDTGKCTETEHWTGSVPNDAGPETDACAQCGPTVTHCETNTLRIQCYGIGKICPE